MNYASRRVSGEGPGQSVRVANGRKDGLGRDGLALDAQDDEARDERTFEVGEADAILAIA